MLTKTNPVIYTGAGPGDPDLITVKGRKACALVSGGDSGIYAMAGLVFELCQKKGCMPLPALILSLPYTTPKAKKGTGSLPGPRRSLLNTEIQKRRWVL